MTRSPPWRSRWSRRTCGPNRSALSLPDGHRFVRRSTGPSVVGRRQERTTVAIANQAERLGWVAGVLLLGLLVVIDLLFGHQINGVYGAAAVLAAVNAQARRTAEVAALA